MKPPLDSDKTTFKNNHSNSHQKHENHPFRRLLIFQVKLAVDALRDIALSPVAIVATLIDLIEGREGNNRFFEKLMQFGRVSERHINLFDQHKNKARTVDTVLNQVEDILVNEYKNGDLSAKAKAAIENKLNLQAKSQKNKPE